ncbi:MULTISPECIES: rhodanese-like domain-containing protein [Thioalkalivibrio]|uniref:Sulfurtransferase n=1 Tax=Thioalkalivibrio versutus TaxID=106634 RepID=A0A0G3G3U3_9GAMM|nr:MULTISPECIES: rhodanese-like domain-containing protein [Thioalkalivibrio]AKJ95893.1 sulfurtransferase [Thioalkalivibrio versutus]OOC48257.1 sulfurtransferase [Thioalkalivibrio versutus]
MLERLPEFLANHPILTGALLAVIGMILFVELRRLNRKYRSLSPVEAVRVINQDDALVLDVREDNEVASGRIGGAKHIPLGSLKKRMGDIEKYKDKPVVVYCRSGNRSASAAQQLTAAGFEDVVNLQGGIQAWQSANMPIKKK